MKPIYPRTEKAVSQCQFIREVEVEVDKNEAL